MKAFEADIEDRVIRSDEQHEINDRGIHAPAASAGRRKLALIVADGIAVVAGVAIAFGLRAAIRPVADFDVLGHLALAATAIPGFALGASINRLYQARANERATQEARNAAKSVAVAVAVLLSAAFLAQFRELSRLWVGLVAVSMFTALLIDRAIARRIFTRLRETGRSVRRIVIVGTDAHAIGLMNTYERNPDLGYSVIGMVGSDANAARGTVGVLGTFDELDAILEREEANGVVMSLASVGAETVNVLTRRLTDHGYHVALSSLLHDIDVTRVRPQDVDGRTMLYVEPVIRRGWRVVAKRAFDIGLASAILIITSPLLLVSIIAIKLESRGPAFFTQVRVGRDGRTFEIIKLRSMVVDAEARKSELASLNEADGPLFKIGRDPRITRVGRVIRKFSIDELPQLICVLRGTMSMVGPRPALPEEAAVWDESTRERLRVHPGLTGLWQVSGRSDSSFDQYRRMDLCYVDNWSLLHDILICTRTVGVVLTGRGAS